MNIFYRLYVLFKIKRVFYTIWFNFKYLPFAQAKKMPIMFYKHSHAKMDKGARIEFSKDFDFSKHKVNIGFSANDFEYQCERTSLNVVGTVIFGGKFEARRGCILDFRGITIFGDDVLFGPRCRCRIYNEAIFGHHLRIAHETQIFDSNLHFSEKVDAPGYYPISRPIKIGNYCWIGNRSTISPGCVLPDYTIVASNSLVNKDFSSLDMYSTIGGIPAKFLRSGYTRVWDTNREKEYHKREFKWIKQ